LAHRERNPSFAHPSTNIRVNVVLLGLTNFHLAFFMSALDDDLEEAITVDGYVARSVQMNRRLSRRHQNPIFAFYVSRKRGARHRREA
jgi:hypothetical protein